MRRKWKEFLDRKGITARIVVLFTVLVIVPYFILALLVFVVFQNYSVSSLGETTADAMTMVSGRISSTIKEYEEASMSLYYSGCVEMLDSENSIEEREKKQIEAFLIACSSSTGVRGCYLVTKDMVICGTGAYPEVIELMKPYENEIIQAGGACRWYPTNKLHGDATENRYVLARSLNSKKEKNVGILYMIMDDRMITQAYNQMQSELSTRYLTTYDGDILYSSDAQKFGEKLDVSMIDSKKISGFHTVRRGIGDETILVSRNLMKTGWYCISVIETKDILMNVIDLVYPFIFISLIYVLFLLIMLIMMKRYIFVPLRILKQTMDDYAQGKLEAVKMEKVGIGEFESLSFHFNSMSARIGNLMIDYKTEVDEKNRQKMQALTAQLTPHFIYNALNTIKWMAVLNHQTNIQNLTESLIHIFMNAARLDDGNYTVKDELMLVENYAVIQKARFMNFDLIIEKDEECLSCVIRKLLLQPIVENAIVHGLGRGKIKNSSILVQVWTDENLHMVVTDKGIGFDVEKWRKAPEKKENHTNIGLHNVEQIINLEYGEPYGMQIESKLGEGTTISYTLPVIRKEMRDDSDNHC